MHGSLLVWDTWRDGRPNYSILVIGDKPRQQITNLWKEISSAKYVFLVTILTYFVQIWHLAVSHTRLSLQKKPQCCAKRLSLTNAQLISWLPKRCAIIASGAFGNLSSAFLVQDDSWFWGWQVLRTVLIENRVRSCHSEANPRADRRARGFLESCTWHLSPCHNAN